MFYVGSQAVTRTSEIATKASPVSTEPDIHKSPLSQILIDNSTFRQVFLYTIEHRYNEFLSKLRYNVRILKFEFEPLYARFLFSKGDIFFRYLHVSQTSENDFQSEKSKRF